MSYEKNGDELPSGKYSIRDIEKEVRKVFATKEVDKMFNNMMFGVPFYVDSNGNEVDLSDQDVVDLKDISPPVQFVKPKKKV